MIKRVGFIAFASVVSALLIWWLGNVCVYFIRIYEWDLNALPTFTDFLKVPWTCLLDPAVSSFRNTVLCLIVIWIFFIFFQNFFNRHATEKRKASKQLSKNQSGYWSHLATEKEIKSGLQLVEFDEYGNIYFESKEYLKAKRWDRWHRFYNLVIQYGNSRRWWDIADVNLKNTIHHWSIGGKDQTVRSGVPLLTYRDRVWVDAADNHSLIIGTTNSGKTYSVINIMIQLSRMSGESMVINDMKGELLMTHRASLVASGYNVIVLNFVDPKNSDCWNILGLVIKRYREAYRYYYQQMNQCTKEKKESPEKPDISEARELLRDLAQTLFYDSRDKDPFWSTKAADLFEGLALLLLEDTTKAHEQEFLEKYLLSEDRIDECFPLTEPVINLKSIKLLLQMGDESITIVRDHNGKEEQIQTSYLGAFIEKRKLYTGDASMKLQDYINSPVNTKGSIRSVFTSKLDVGLINDNLTRMISSQSFNMDDLGKKKTALFLIVHDEKSTYYNLVSIFIKQMYEEIIKVSRGEDNLRLPRPINIIYDEFGISPALKDIENMLAAMRSRGVRMNMVVQDYAQLDKTYGHEGAKTIKSNVMNTVYLLGGDSQTIKEISQRSGRKMIWDSEKKSYREAPVISEDQLSQLSLGQVVILRQRRNPSITRLTAWDKYCFYPWIQKLTAEYSPLKEYALPFLKVYDLHERYEMITSKKVTKVPDDSDKDNSDLKKVTKRSNKPKAPDKPNIDAKQIAKSEPKNEVIPNKIYEQMNLFALTVTDEIQDCKKDQLNFDRGGSNERGFGDRP